MRVGRLLNFGMSLRVLTSASQASPCEHANRGGIASFRDRGTTSVDGSVICPRRRVNDVPLLCHFPICVRIRVGVLRVNRLLRQCGYTGNDKAVRAFAWFPEVTSLAGPTLWVTYDRISTSYRHVVVAVDGT